MFKPNEIILLSAQLSFSIKYHSVCRKASLKTSSLGNGNNSDSIVLFEWTSFEKRKQDSAVVTSSSVVIKDRFSLNVRVNRNAFPNMLLVISSLRCFYVTFIDLLQVLKSTFTLPLLRQGAFLKSRNDT